MSARLDSTAGAKMELIHWFVISLYICCCQGLLLMPSIADGDVLIVRGDDSCATTVFAPNIPVFGGFENSFRICIDGKVEGSHFSPFNLDYSTRATGSVWYSVIASGSRLTQVSSIVSSRRHDGFEADWMLLATWWEVPKYTCQSAGQSECQETNTFQLALISDRNYTYALYSYGSLEVWTTDRGNVKIGLGPTNSDWYRQVSPDYQTQEALKMGQPGRFSSNMEIPGVWMFNATGSNMSDTCNIATPCGPAPNLCTNLPSVSNEKAWSCDCAQGFYMPAANNASAFPYCLDVDECQVSSCQNIASCYNTYGSYRCVCNTGYMESNVTSNVCVDIDECDSRPCQRLNEICYNTEGSYRCNCLPGYVRAGICHDINECALSSPCSNYSGTVCRNTVGSFRCACEFGYEPIAGNSCQDINECVHLADACPDTIGSTCLNTNGSYLCVCNTGYRFDELFQRCIEEEECTDEMVGYVTDTSSKFFVLTNLAVFYRDIVLGIVSDACETVNVNVTERVGGQQAFSSYEIEPFKTHSVVLGSTPFVPEGDSFTHTTLVQADKDVSIHVYFGLSSSVAAFLLYPVDVLGSTYLLNIPSNELSAQNKTEVTLISLGHQFVEIRLPVGVPESDVRNKRDIGDGSILTLTMDVYQIHKFGVVNLDLSGTQIVGTGKLAVFVVLVDVVTTQTRAHQVPPQVTLGTLYMQTEFHGKVRVVSTQPDTEVSYHRARRYMREAGEIYIVTNYVGIIETNKPVSVVAISAQYNGLADDEILYPLESVISDRYTFSTVELSVTNETRWGLVVVTHTAYRKDLRLNGVILDEYFARWVIPFDGATFCYAKVYDLRHGVYTIVHPAPEVGFLATFYLYNTVATLYSYPVGAFLRDQTCVPSYPMVIGDGKDNDCDGRVDEEICDDGEDFDEDGVGDEDCGSAVETVVNPRPEPELLTKTCCHGSVCHISCPENHTISIVQSHYGRYNYIGEKTCGTSVDEMLLCGLEDTNDIFIGRCQGNRSCSLEVTGQLFKMRSNCTLKSLYAVVDYMCLAPADVNCTLPAVRHISLLSGRKQFVASNPPAHPAFAHSEVLTHHDNIDNGVHTDYTYLHTLGEPALACLPEYAHMAAGLMEWCTDETEAIGAYIQVYIDGPYRVTAVILQGARTEQYWVTMFSLQYSADDREQLWHTVVNAAGDVKIFEGCTDATQTVVRHLGDSSFTAKYVRLVVEGYHRYAALHLDFLRCVTVEGCTHVTVPHSSLVQQAANYLESFVVTCDHGYLTAQSSLSFHAICDRHGNWRGITSCEEITCGPFRTVDDANPLPIQAYPFLNNLRFLGQSGADTCPSDSDMVGLTYIKCHEYSSWTHVPVCQIRENSECNFPEVDHSIVYVATLNVGCKAHYQCVPGYKLKTSMDTLTCSSGGVVTGNVPECEQIL